MDGFERRLAILESRLASLELRRLVRLGGLTAAGSAVLAATIKH